MESLLGLPLAEYEEIMGIYTNSGTDVKNEYYRPYLRARVLDMARESCSVLLMLFFVLCACFALYLVFLLLSTSFVYVKLGLRPCTRRRCCSPWLQCFKYIEGKVQARLESDATVETLMQVKNRVRVSLRGAYTGDACMDASHDQLLSYRMENNQRYLGVQQALHFVPD